MLDSLTDPQIWIALVTLTAMEIVLGIDNIIFISILVDKLPPARRELARRLGLFMAMFMRIGLLLVLAWIVGLVAPLFTVPVVPMMHIGRSPAARSAVAEAEQRPDRHLVHEPCAVVERTTGIGAERPGARVDQVQRQDELVERARPATTAVRRSRQHALAHPRPA